LQPFLLTYPKAVQTCRFVRFYLRFLMCVFKSPECENAFLQTTHFKIFFQCESSCVVSNFLIVKTLCHKLHTCKAFLQCESTCAVSKKQQLKMIYHKSYICKVFLQCESACGFLNSALVKTFYYKLNNNKVSL